MNILLRSQQLRATVLAGGHGMSCPWLLSVIMTHDYLNCMCRRLEYGWTGFVQMLHMQRLVRQGALGLRHRRQRAAWLAWRGVGDTAVVVREAAAQLQLRVVQRLRNQVCCCLVADAMMSPLCADLWLFDCTH